VTLNESAIDNQLHEARAMMLDLFGDDETITLEQASKLIYLAYGKGYADATREDDEQTRLRTAEALGLIDRSTGERFL
jgi:hypothetical protein